MDAYYTGGTHHVAAGCHGYHSHKSICSFRNSMKMLEEVLKKITKL